MSTAGAPVHEGGAGPATGRLTGKTAIITGAAAGMGAAAAERFVAEGASVVIGDVDGQGADALAARLGGAVISAQLDVSSRADWQSCVATTLRAFGRIDVLFNNAGVAGSATLESTTAGNWRRTLDVDAYGALLGMQAVVPTMRRCGGGSIINTSSLQGLEADVGLLPYVAAKFALRGITKSAAVELGRDRIRVNAIFPGVIDTGMNADGGSRSYGRIPLRLRHRSSAWGAPADICGLAVYLASDASRYVSGAEVVVDGGKSVRFPSIFDAIHPGPVDPEERR